MEMEWKYTTHSIHSIAKGKLTCNVWVPTVKKSQADGEVVFIVRETGRYTNNCICFEISHTGWELSPCERQG